MNYRIIGKCPFGTGVVDANGQPDASQFCGKHPEDYIIAESGGRLAVNVAAQYGAKPVCQVVTDFCTIDVYKIGTYYGTITQYPEGVYSTHDVVWLNTVNPAALVEYAWLNRPSELERATLSCVAGFDDQLNQAEQKAKAANAGYEAQHQAVHQRPGSTR